MARTFVMLPEYEGQDAYSGNLDDKFEEWMLAVRDALRTALDPDGLHTHWRVGDIAKWGHPTQSAYDGYAFTVAHMSAATPTGPEWLFAFPGTFDSGLVDIDDIFQNNRVSEYFKDLNHATTITTNGPPAFHYSPVGGYNLGYDANGHLSGGDFSAPPTNPYINLDALMPETGALYGLIPTNGVGQGIGAVAGKWGAVFDTKPFLALYIKTVRDPRPNVIWLSGDVMVNYEDSDTDTHLSAAWEIAADWRRMGYFFREWIYAYDPVHVRQRFNLGIPPTPAAEIPFFYGIYPNDESPWNSVIVATSAYFKGWIDTDIMRILGTSNAMVSQFFEDGSLTFAKLHQALGFPYVPETLLFPLTDEG